MIFPPDAENASRRCLGGTGTSALGLTFTAGFF
jgi:hypothetical protein